MKKIGILYGQERTFPEALVERINSKKIKGISAEPVMVGEVMQNQATDYTVIIDRISHDAPFYRAYLKNAAATGTIVLNNPFWWSADEKYFNNVLAEQIGVAVPKTVLLPSHTHPDDTTSASFTNLKFPLDWQKMLDYLGDFPLWMKPHSGGGWKSVYKVESLQEIWDAYNETAQLVMMLQEGIEFTSYFRCYCIGRKHVRIMNYEPRNPHHLRYQADFDVSDELLETIKEGVLKLNKALGYDFNTVEFAVRDGIPIAIDFCNPAPDADYASVGPENFEWVVETMANYAIERAQAHDGTPQIEWGTFVSNAVEKAPAKKTTVKKTTAKKAAPKKRAVKK